MCPPILLNPFLLDAQWREAEVNRRLSERWVAFDDDKERERVARQVFCDVWSDPKYVATMNRLTRIVNGFY